MPPYLRLPPPFSHLILTPPPPPNTSDIASLKYLLNDPLIYPRLLTPPYPYTTTDAENFFKTAHAEATAFLEAIEEEEGGFVDGFPFRCLRDTTVTDSNGDGEDQEDGGEGKGRLIGIISLSRYNFHEFVGPEQATAVEKNLSLPIGDRGVVWEFGDFISPLYHNKGIMTTVIHTIITHWAIPHLNTHTIKASMYMDNIGSVRVFAKNGFEMEYTREDWVVLPEKKGGGVKSIYVMVWKR